jgi:hypothetical protein
MEVIGMINNLWFHDKMSWETKEKINAYIFRHADDQALIEELYNKASYYQDHMDEIPENAITY